MNETKPNTPVGRKVGTPETRGPAPGRLGCLLNPVFLFEAGSPPGRIPGMLMVCLTLLLLISPRAVSQELRVMTFNLRYASTNSPNAWLDRRPVMKNLLESRKPDLFGTQEGLYPQLKDLASDLPEYAWIGLGRDGGSHGEFMAIFFRRERFEPMEYDHFWLSDTPEVMGSSTWGNSNRRMVTWVRFKDLESGREFHFWNTHLDHAIQSAREKGATLIRRRIAELHTSLPLLLVGDFNAVAGANPAYDILTEDGFLKDTWKLAGSRENAEYNSFNNFEEPRKNGQRIDWILCRGDVEVKSEGIVVFQENGQWPSDHFPILAHLVLK